MSIEAVCRLTAQRYHTWMPREVSCFTTANRDQNRNGAPEDTPERRLCGTTLSGKLCEGPLRKDC
jgi:hypothetical protein